MLKLLLNVVTAGIGALVVLENTFLYACIKEEPSLCSSGQRS
jgi:hypothetical protein